MVGLHPPPVGDVNNIEDIVRRSGRGSTSARSLPESRSPDAATTTRCSRRAGIPRARIWTARPPNIPSFSPTCRDIWSRPSALLAASNITAETPDPPAA